MAKGHGIGREFRCRLQEEAKRTNGGRVTEEFMDRSDTLRGFHENALALDELNYRIEGRRPQVMLEDCSLRELAAECIVDRHGNPVGAGYIEEMFKPENAANHLRMTRMREAGDISAVDYTMFAGISGQLLINSSLPGWEHEEFLFTKAAGVYNTMFIDGETVPGVSLPFTKDIADNAAGGAKTEDMLLVKPQQSIPYLTMAENYIRLPETEWRAGIMAIDRTAVYFDRTGQVAQKAAGGAYIFGARKEQRGLDLLIGADSVPYIEKYAFDSSPMQLDPYQYASGSSNGQLAYGTDGAGRSCSGRPFGWVNDIPSNYYTDWTAFQTADQYAAKLVDPNNGLPIMFKLPTLFAPFTQRFNIAVVLKAFQTWRISQNTSSTFGAGSINTVGPNPVTEVLTELNIQLSKMLRQQMVASGLYGDSEVAVGSNPEAGRVWFYGNFKEAIKYDTNWNLKVIMAPANSYEEFHQDIIMQWRYDERGRWAWHNPRYVQRHNYRVGN